MHQDALQSPSGLGASATWRLTLPPRAGVERALPFHLDSLRLALFGTGFAFRPAVVRGADHEITSFDQLLRLVLQ